LALKTPIELERKWVGVRREREKERKDIRDAALALETPTERESVCVCVHRKREKERGDIRDSALALESPTKLTNIKPVKTHTFSLIWGGYD